MDQAMWRRTAIPGVYRRDGLRGRRYRVMYRDAAGRQHIKHFDRLEDARRFKGNVTAERPDHHPDEKRTLGELFDAQGRARAYAEETLSTRRSAWAYLKPWADTPLSRITPAVVDEMLAGVKGPAMRNKVRSLASTLFGYAIENRKRWGVTSNPVSRPPKRRTREEKLLERPEQRKRYLSNDELGRLLDAIPERFRALVELMARMGLRPGEAYALRMSKFDPLGRRLLIDTSISGWTKTGEARTLQLPSPIADMLTEHVRQFSDPIDADAMMFPTERGRMINPDRFRSITFAKAARTAGLDDVTPNMLRHTAASFAISTGANVYDVQRMLGHAKASMTMDVYGELFEEQHERFVQAYGEAITRARADRRSSSVVALRPS
jgi:integrase